MLKKEYGRYARFATASLTAMRYQCRIGVLAAGDYGVAQVRVQRARGLMLFKGFMFTLMPCFGLLVAEA